MPTVYPAKTMFLREGVGTATDPETGEVITISRLMNGAPLIELSDGRYVIISWQEIVTMAVNAANAPSAPIPASHPTHATSACVTPTDAQCASPLKE